jgi:hypothetical protein
MLSAEASGGIDADAISGSVLRDFNGLRRHFLPASGAASAVGRASENRRGRLALDVRAATTEPAAFDPNFPVYPDFPKNARLFVFP